MSEETPEEDKTEAPSHKRLDKAFDEGNIPMGRELHAVAGFVAGTVALVSFGGSLRDSLVRLVVASTEGVAAGWGASPRSLTPMVGRSVLIIGTICTIAVAASALAFIPQTRGRMWMSLAMPDLSRVFKAGKFAKLFSKQTALDVVISVVKLLTVAWACWSTLRDDFLTLPRLLFARPDVQFAMLFSPLARGAVKVLTIMGFWAGVDLALQQLRYRKRMRMTKEEAKREYKEDEGDGMIKSRRRRKHRELAKGRAAKEVPIADALIVNPTHIAIAIRYRPGELGGAPRVTAKGKGVLAEYMRELARDNGIPIVENIPLARLLYRRVKVGRAVPAETYKAIAAILAYVYRLTGRMPSGKAATGARP